MSKKTTIGIIGAGNMGGAIIGGIHQEYSVYVCEQDKRRVQALKRKYKIMSCDLKELLQKSDAIILAVKPQGFDAVLSDIKEEIKAFKRLVFISIAAGITCQYIEKRLGEDVRVVRTMPNLPVQVGQGMTGICSGKNAKKSDLTLTNKLFKCIGKAVIVDEKWLDAVTAVSGSGPAYVFLFIECFMKAACSLGFDAKTARLLVEETIRGSWNFFEGQSEGADVLRARVTSKGGTTQAALEVFKKNNFEKTFVQALKAAEKRAKELAK